MPILQKHRCVTAVLAATVAFMFMSSAQAQSLGSTVQVESKINKDSARLTR